MNTFTSRPCASPMRRWCWRHSEVDRCACDRPLVGREEPPAGAHLVTRRLGFVHHGICVGAGRVIHSGAVSGILPRGPVEEVSLEDFSRGRPVSVRSAVPARFTPQEVIARARSRLGEDRYDLLRNNCEHLCEWCLHGRARSYQVERLTSWLRLWDRIRGGARPAYPASAPSTSVFVRRHIPGLVPSIRRNERLRCGWSAKPQASAISES